MFVIVSLNTYRYFSIRKVEILIMNAWTILDSIIIIPASLRNIFTVPPFQSFSIRLRIDSSHFSFYPYLSIRIFLLLGLLRQRIYLHSILLPLMQTNKPFLVFRTGKKLKSLGLLLLLSGGLPTFSQLDFTMCHSGRWLFPTD